MSQAVGRDPYVYIDLPTSSTTSKKLCAHVSETFSIQWGREVSAFIMRMPERADWKACQVDRNTETEYAEAFKADFQKFDFTL